MLFLLITVFVIQIVTLFIVLGLQDKAERAERRIDNLRDSHNGLSERISIRFDVDEKFRKETNQALSLLGLERIYRKEEGWVKSKKKSKKV